MRTTEPWQRMSAVAAAWLAAALATAVAGAQGVARRRPPALVIVSAHVELTLGPGAEQCPGESMLHDEVARRLGYDPFAPGAKGKPVGQIRTRIARSAEGLTATTEYVDAAGVLQWTRPYEVKGTSTRDCEVAISGVAVELASELTLFEEEPPAPRPPASALPPVAPEPPPPRRSLHPRLEIGGGVSAVFGIAPAPALSGAFHVGVDIFPFEGAGPWFSFSGELRGDVPSSGAVHATDSLRTSLLAGVGLVCIHQDPKVWARVTGSFFVCPVGMAGALNSTVESAGGSVSSHGTYVGVGARAGLEARFASRAALRLQGEWLGAAHRVHWGGAYAGDVQETPPLSFSAGLAGVFFF
jgi:hypothetical protein